MIIQINAVLPTDQEIVFCIGEVPSILQWELVFKTARPTPIVVKGYKVKEIDDKTAKRFGRSKYSDWHNPVPKDKIPGDLITNGISPLYFVLSDFAICVRQKTGVGRVSMARGLSFKDACNRYFRGKDKYNPDLMTYCGMSLVQG